MKYLYTLLFFFEFSTLTLFSANNDEASDTVTTEDIIVTANRYPRVFGKTSRFVNVIPVTEIKTAPASCAEDLLINTTSLDVRQRGALGVQADIGIRGGTFEQTLILLNGVPLNDPQTGHHNMSLPVPYDNIKKIEILKGPGSRILGPNAFSGAVNIITGNSFDNGLHLAASGGEHNQYDYTLSGSADIGGISNYLSYSQRASDGYMANTDFKMRNIYYQGAYNPGIGKFSLQAGYTDKAFGANSFYTAKYPDQFEQVKTMFTNIGFKAGKDFQYNPVVYWRRNYDKFELFRSNAPDWYKSHNYHRTDVAGVMIKSLYLSDYGRSAFGADYRYEGIQSNVLGISNGDSVPVPGEQGAFYTRADSRSNFGLYAEHGFTKGIFDFNAGAMFFYNSRYKWNITAGTDLSLELNDKLRITGSLNQSLRLPTFTDLYYQGPTNTGNPELKPEKALTAEAGLKYYERYFFAEMAVFRRWGSNMIDWVRLSPDEKWKSMNLTKVNTTGFEITSGINPREIFYKDFFVKRFSVSYSHLNSDKNSGSFESYYVMDYLKNKITTTVLHEIISGLEANWSLSWQDRAGFYDDIKTGEPVNYMPYLLINLRLTQEFRDFRIFAEGNNLLDSRYVYIGNLPMPGRWLRMGIVYDFKF